jgi:DNA invertase Pin-like site-specific DNA recombinase
MKPLRCALYARVSTVNHGQDPELQLAELRQYAGHRGLQIVGEFVDHASGSKDSRPELNRLMTDARRRKFDMILVWKLDRWARSLRWLINSLAELEHLGVAFVSYRDNIDLSTPAGRLMVQILGAMGEFEKSLIQERVVAGLRNARAKGKKLGRPKRHIDLSQVEKLRARPGATWQSVARELNIPISTLFRAVAGSTNDNRAA